MRGRYTKFCALFRIDFCRMMKRGKCLAITFSAFLFVNAFVLVFRKKITFRNSRQFVWNTFAVDGSGELASEAGNGFSTLTITSTTPGNHFSTNHNTVETTVSPINRSTTESYNHRKSFFRLGTQLKIDYSEMCPPTSVMLDDGLKEFRPKYQDCPTLFVVGARKGGTTSLYSYVAQHPNFDGIFLNRGPMAGETFYFSVHWDHWDWSHYMKIFQNTKSMSGESSVGNLVDCKVPRRVWESCGKQAKIVALLRNPLKRFESNFLMRVALGNYPRNKSIVSVVDPQVNEFKNAAGKKNLRVENLTASWNEFRCLFKPSRNLMFEGLYYVHLMTWLCNFPAENILILNSEEFFENTASVLSEVISFLGLSPLGDKELEAITSKTYNGNSKKYLPFQYLSAEDKKKMMEIYKHTNEPLLELLDWKDVGWT